MKLLLLAAFCLAAAAVFAGDFTLTDTSSLKLDFKGTQIVAGKTSTLLKRDGFVGAKITKVKGTFTDTPDGGLRAYRLRCLFISAKCGDFVIDCDPSEALCGKLVIYAGIPVNFDKGSQHLLTKRFSKFSGVHLRKRNRICL